MMVFKLDQIARQRTLIAFNQEMKMILSGQMSYCCIMIKKKKKKINQARFCHFQAFAYLDLECPIHKILLNNFDL